MTPDPVWHGGDLDAARRLFPQAPEPWIDLSTGINPVPYPIGILPESVFQLLPSPAQLAELEAVAAHAYRAAPPAHVVAAPGTQALLELLPHLRPPGRVRVLGPTYAEHALCWRKAGHAVEDVTGLDEAGAADVLVVVNPNNPDGRRISPGRLLQAAAHLARRGGVLVVDEAFADFENADSLAPELPDNAVVLRSFGKAYGLAGIRLGFLIASPALAGPVRERLGPWAVSGPALAAGLKALADPHWLHTAGAARARDAARLDALVTPVMGPTVGGTVLFRSFSCVDAPDIFARLGRAGIFVRRFSYDFNLLRFGLPGCEEEWDRLQVVLDVRA